MDSSPVLETAELTSRERIAPGFWCLGFTSSGVARRARPAQYVAIDIPGDFSVRLPLGIWTAEGDAFTLLFREWGRRTNRLAGLPVGGRLSMIGPLGNTFDIPARGLRATIVAGGIGVVPFWLLAKELQAAGVATTVILGARTKEALIGAAELERFGARMVLCTDDGSAGRHGTVLDALAKSRPPDMFYGCGPPRMLRALCDHANTAGLPCQISMEETFGCSMGTCWGCVVPVRRGCPQGTGYPKAPGESREYDFARVCTDGTVFSAADVRWLA
jgi:dihydroorotate dehydrogenase electron transfer subunit